MSEETLDSINQAYTNKCAAVADAQFKIKNLTRFVEALFLEIEEIDKRAADFRAKINDITENKPKKKSKK